MRYHVPEPVTSNVVFIDGPTRAGKSLLSGIISSFQKTNQIDFFYDIERIIPAVELGGVEFEYADAVLSSILNQYLYNHTIGRKVNFRPDDQTGVLNSPNVTDYIGRLTKQDGDHVIDEIEIGDRMYPFMTHNLMYHFDILQQLSIDFNLIHMFRNPIDNVYSMWKRGLGERYGEDPRLFELAIAYRGAGMPWYSAPHAEDWQTSTPPERCIIDHFHLVDEIITNFQNASTITNVRPVFFESIVTNPYDEIQALADYLGEEQSDATPNEIQNAKCPRDESDILDRRNQREKELKAVVRKDLFEKLKILENKYQKNHYGIKYN
jgi:hypothetical protein